jgi:spermidine synthase
VVIVDSSDPIGPAETLFEDSFFVAVRGALRADGILCTQGECMHLHTELIGRLIAFTSTLFDHALYASTSIPTYPCGQIGHLICALGERSPAVPARSPSALTLREQSAQQSEKGEQSESAGDHQLRYYSSKMHRASFVLPAHIARHLRDAKSVKN